MLQSDVCVNVCTNVCNENENIQLHTQSCFVLQSDGCDCVLQSHVHTIYINTHRAALCCSQMLCCSHIGMYMTAYVEYANEVEFVDVC